VCRPSGCRGEEKEDGDPKADAWGEAPNTRSEVAGLKYFGNFHCRLQNTCVAQASAERKIKHAKRMIAKHRFQTKPETVVRYMLASSRKDVKEKGN
jgi:hypothetical protein